MSTAKLDANAWYGISEARVANVSDPLTTNLQQTGNGLRVFGKTNAVWQFQPVAGVDGRYLMRLSTSGIFEQLSVCLDPDEIADSRTTACMRKSESDESQQWDISEWANMKDTFKFTNVANGTDFVLDVHPGSNLFMNGKVEGKDGDTTEYPAQHWIMTSSKPVNDGAYSTIYSASTNTASTIESATATGTGGATTATAGSGTASPSSSSSPSSSPSAGLSSGAAAGIGVGVSLGAIAILGAAFFFWWRRRKAAKGTAVPQSEHHHELGHDGSTVEKSSPGTVNASTVGSSPSPANDYYAQESKVLGHMQPHSHAAEAQTNPIYEAPSDVRYELDSGQTGPAPAQLPDDYARR